MKQNKIILALLLCFFSIQNSYSQENNTEIKIYEVDIPKNLTRSDRGFSYLFILKKKGFDNTEYAGSSYWYDKENIASCSKGKKEYSKVWLNMGYSIVDISCFDRVDLGKKTSDYALLKSVIVTDPDGIERVINIYEKLTRYNSLEVCKKMSDKINSIGKNNVNIENVGKTIMELQAICFPIEGW